MRQNPKGKERQGKELPCMLCGKLTYIPQYRIKDFKYCSRTCVARAVLHNPENRAKAMDNHSGEKHWNWKGGKTTDVHGYTIITIDKQQVKEHRYVMEQYLGYQLDPKEIVHHRNGDKTDNRIENLVVMSQAEHMKEHNTLINKWSKHYDRCQDCRTTINKHMGLGRCRPCYKKLKRSGQ